MAKESINADALIKIKVDRQNFQETASDLKRLNEAMKQVATTQSAAARKLDPPTAKRILGEGRAQYRIGEAQTRIVTGWGKEVQAVKQVTSYVRLYNGELRKVVETYRLLNKKGQELAKPKLLKTDIGAGGKVPFSAMTEEFYRVQAGLGSFKGNFAGLFQGGDTKALTQKALAQFKIQAGKIVSSNLLMNQQLPSGEIVNQQVITYLDKTTNKMKEATITYAQGKKGMQALGAEIRNAAANAGKATTMFGKMGTILMRAAETVPVWMAIRSIMVGITEAIQSGIQFWKEFESAMTEIAIASNTTTANLQALGQTVLNFSTVFGISASKSLEAAKLFAQQGLSIQETIDMTKTAMLGAAVLGKEVTEVAEDLTAGVRAYNIPIKDSIVLVDQWMKVQKEFAVTAKDLAEGMKTAGATAAALNISKESFAGNLTAIIEVTRKSGSEAGNALQMIYSRLLTQGKDAIQTIAKVPVYLDSQKKATFSVSESLRSQEDVLYDLAQAWKTLGSSEKEQLAVQIGSRRQLTPFMALMDNFTRGLEAQTAAFKAAGTAYDAYIEKQKTVAFQITQMQNSWLQLAQSVEQTGAWKAAIGFLREFADTLSLIINYQNWLSNVLKQTSVEDDLKTQKIIEQAKAYELLKTKIEEAQKSGNPKRAKQYQEMLDSLGNIPIKSVADAEQAQRLKELAQTQIEEQARKSENANLILLMRKYGPMSWTLNAGKNLWSKATTGQWAENEGDVQLRRANAEVGAKNTLLLQEQRNKIAKQFNEIQAKDEEEVQKTEQQVVALIDHRADILKLLGATEKQILEFKIAQYEMSDKLIGDTQRQLQLDKMKYDMETQITKEKLHQVDLVDESVQLYKMAQKYGPRTAEDIAQYIRQGNIQDILGDEGTRPNRLGMILKEFFPQMEEQFRMRKYFEVGRGTGIQIQERASLNQSSLYNSQQWLMNNQANRWPMQDIFQNRMRELTPTLPPQYIEIKNIIQMPDGTEREISTFTNRIQNPNSKERTTLNNVIRTEMEKY